MPLYCTTVIITIICIAANGTTYICYENSQCTQLANPSSPTATSQNGCCNSNEVTHFIHISQPTTCRTCQGLLLWCEPCSVLSSVSVCMHISQAYMTSFFIVHDMHRLTFKWFLPPMRYFLHTYNLQLESPYFFLVSLNISCTPCQGKCVLVNKP